MIAPQTESGKMLSTAGDGGKLARATKSTSAIMSARRLRAVGVASTAPTFARVSVQTVEKDAFLRNCVSVTGRGREQSNNHQRTLRHRAISMSSTASGLVPPALRRLQKVSSCILASASLKVFSYVE